MKILALDTATEACSVALQTEAGVLSQCVPAGRQHTEVLPQMVAAILAEAGLTPSALDGLICGLGPGSFAGLRIGVAYAKGLAAGLGLPLQGVSSLALLAQGAWRKHRAERVLAAIDARMEQVYFGVYGVREGCAQALLADRVCDPYQVTGPTSVVSSQRFAGVGTGWARYGSVLLRRFGEIQVTPVDAEALPEACDALDLIEPASWASLAVRADVLAPLYLRDRVALTCAEQIAARRPGSPSAS